MIESYLLGIATGFFLGVAVMAIPERLRRAKGEFVDITRRKR